MSDMRALLVLMVSFVIVASPKDGSIAFSLPTSQPTASQQTTSQQTEEPTFRSTVTDVQVELEVSERGRQITDLKLQDFKILDNSQPQPVVYFGRDSVPLDLVLLLDVSGSVQKYLRDIASISRSALRELKNQDQVAVMVFGRDSWIEQSFTNDQAAISNAIDQASHEAPVGSGTRIYAAIQAAAQYAARRQTGEVRRRAILIVTDNDGMSYGVHRKDVVRALFEADAVLDAIAVGRHPHPPAPRAGAVINPDFAFDDVFPLADITGGEAIAASKPQDRLAEMLMRLRSRYSLVYHIPAGAEPGSYRQIQVQLTEEAKRAHPHAILNARDGYYVNREEPKKDDEHQPAQ